MSHRRRRARLPLLLVVLFPPVALVARFLSGRVLWRRTGPWDARYLTWAADPPSWVYAMRDEPHPCGTWARRPGWHRQVARLAPIVALLAVTRGPTADGLTLAVAALAALTLVVTRRRPRIRTTSPGGPILLEDAARRTQRAVPPPREHRDGWGEYASDQLYSPDRRHSR